jgi:8-oxo-dGTP diphosphatase
MAHHDDRWAAAFPTLFARTYVDYADCDLGFTAGPVPDELVSRLHLVAKTTHGRLIVCRSIQGWRFLPGGTREPGEPLVELAGRELREEAGARLTGSVTVFASHVADSRRETPHRPHLPHPRTYWAYGVTEADLVGQPTNPDDGEHVVEVLALPLADAAGYLEEHDPLHADVVRLARAMDLI